MSRNNIKLLTARQLDFFNDKYVIECDDENVYVTFKYYKRRTPHPINKPFDINSEVRKISFTVEAISLWRKMKDKYTLFDVQQAVNICHVTYQDVNESNVRKALKSPLYKIKEEE